MTFKPAPPPGAQRAWFVMAFSKKDFWLYGPFSHPKTADAFGRNTLKNREKSGTIWTVVNLPHEKGAIAIAGNIIKVPTTI